MDDKVLREVTILARDFQQLSRDMWELRKALLGDERFASLVANEMALSGDQGEMFTPNKTGPADLTDPFSMPLRESD